MLRTRFSTDDAGLLQKIHLLLKRKLDSRQADVGFSFNFTLSVLSFYEVTLASIVIAFWLILLSKNYI